MPLLLPNSFSSSRSPHGYLWWESEERKRKGGKKADRVRTRSYSFFTMNHFVLLVVSQRTPSSRSCARKEKRKGKGGRKFLSSNLSFFPVIHLPQGKGMGMFSQRERGRGKEKKRGSLLLQASHSLLLKRGPRQGRGGKKKKGNVRKGGGRSAILSSSFHFPSLRSFPFLGEEKGPCPGKEKERKGGKKKNDGKSPFYLFHHEKKGKKGGGRDRRLSLFINSSYSLFP